MPPIPIDEPVSAAELQAPLKLRPSPAKSKQKKKAKTTNRDSSSPAVKGQSVAKAPTARSKKQAGKKLVSKKRKAGHAAVPAPIAKEHKLVQCALPWATHAPTSSMGRSTAASSASSSRPAPQGIPTGLPDSAALIELPRSNYFFVCSPVGAWEERQQREPPPAAAEPLLASASDGLRAPAQLDATLESSNEALEAELAAIRAEMIALRLAAETGAGDDELLGGEVETAGMDRADASTQASLPWRGHGGWLMTPGWNATTRPMGKVYDEAG
jgi:hypothetical protein